MADSVYKSITFVRQDGASSLDLILSAMKTKSFLFISAIVILLSLMACEANKQVFVTVYDQVSKKPVDSVYVVIKAGKNGDYTKSGAMGYTDSTGRFNTFFMIGCTFGCYDVFVEFNKNGYSPLTTFDPKDSSVVYLKPLSN